MYEEMYKEIGKVGTGSTSALKMLQVVKRLEIRRLIYS